MKKNLMTYAAGRMVLAFAFCCAMTMTVLTSCTKDNDNLTGTASTCCHQSR